MNDSTRTHGAPNRHVYDWEHEQNRPVPADRAAPPSLISGGGAPVTQPRDTRELGQNEGQPAASPIAGRLALGFDIGAGTWLALFVVYGVAPIALIVLAVATLRLVEAVGAGTWGAALVLYTVAIVAGVGGARIYGPRGDDAAR